MQRSITQADPDEPPTFTRSRSSEEHRVLSCLGVRSHLAPAPCRSRASLIAPPRHVCAESKGEAEPRIEFDIVTLTGIAKDSLSNFADANGEAKYTNVLYKDLDEEFLRWVTENTRRYIGIFAGAIDELMPESTEPFPDDDHDVLLTQRSEDKRENVDGVDPLQKMHSEPLKFEGSPKKFDFLAPVFINKTAEFRLLKI
ncbi:hypothetical protein NL676_034541 [Syzygium grande]|nr:hypothetical protein NL676_034541 [Syzygium grande]